MTTPPLPPRDEQRPLALKEQTELLDFLQEQSEKNRVHLREEANAVRGLFISTARWVGIPFGIFIAIAAWFSWSSLRDMKQDLVSQAQAAATLQVQQSKDELQKSQDDMKQQVKDKLQEEFRTERLHETMRVAAEKAVNVEAKGFIESISRKVATERIDKALKPVLEEARQDQDARHMQELIARANNNEASAFDELVEFESNPPPNTAETIKSAIASLHEKFPSYNTGRDQCDFPDPKTGTPPNIQGCANQLTVEDAHVPEEEAQKKRAMAKQKGPKLVEFALSTQSLSERAMAIYGVNAIYKVGPNGFDSLDIRSLREWWRSHKPIQ